MAAVGEQAADGEAGLAAADDDGVVVHGIRTFRIGVTIERWAM